MVLQFRAKAARIIAGQRYLQALMTSGHMVAYCFVRDATPNKNKTLT
ncbi:hypothetical protein [Sporomusa malonica]|nr:hypothetical protein [Sporomusa malonica]